MSKDIRKIEINQNWFYHRLKEEDFDKIILSKGLKSARQLKKKEKVCNFAGKDFISLSKKIDMKENVSISNYSYNYYIDLHYAYVIEINKDHPIKTKYIKEYNNFYGFLCNLPIHIRFSPWLDEYQVKDEISLDKIKGIKIPNLKSELIDLEYIKMILEYLLKKMDFTGYSFPFIDIEEKKIIEKRKIKEYINGAIERKN